MSDLELVAKIAVLWRKWKGGGPIDIAYLRAIIKRERNVYESGVLRCSAGLLTEIRAEQKIIGMAYVRGICALGDGAP